MPSVLEFVASPGAERYRKMFPDRLVTTKLLFAPLLLVSTAVAARAERQPNSVAVMVPVAVCQKSNVAIGLEPSADRCRFMISVGVSALRYTASAPIFPVRKLPIPVVSLHAPTVKSDIGVARLSPAVYVYGFFAYVW